MATYCFKCPDCGRTISIVQSMHDPLKQPTCPCGVQMRRDWQAGVPDVHIPMHMSARNTSNKSDFLPSTKDFESPTDPTGENGMKKWKDEHTTVGFREI